MSNQVWWYTARAGGLVSWGLATAAVVWGLLLSGRFARKPKPAWVLDLHRFLGALTVIFVAVHLLALWFDSFVQFGPAELFIPFASGWKPGAVALGIVATYLLVAIEVTSMLQRRIPRRLWHAIHLSSFGLFAFATVHALTAGSDATTTPVRVFALASTVVVVNLTVLRIVSRRAGRAPAPGRAAAPRQSVGARP
jgi:sulfoxide reductase heme-binding subunit YedZ